MPDPDRLVQLHQARLYLRTPDRPDLEQFLEAVLAGGVDVVQLRHKGLDARTELGLCELVGGVAARHGALWAVNDRADLAYVARPDALHLGQADLPTAAARHLVGDGVLVGRSAHDLEQARAAAVETGVDYLFVGPVLPGARRPRPGAGLGLVRDLAALDPVRPWFAEGGVLDADGLAEVLAAGASRVVVGRALTRADDPGAVATAFARLLAAAPG